MVIEYLWCALGRKEVTLVTTYELNPKSPVVTVATLACTDSTNILFRTSTAGCCLGLPPSPPPPAPLLFGDIVHSCMLFFLHFTSTTGACVWRQSFMQASFEDSYHRLEAGSSDHAQAGSGSRKRTRYLLVASSLVVLYVMVCTMTMSELPSLLAALPILSKGHPIGHRKQNHKVSVSYDDSEEATESLFERLRAPIDRLRAKSVAWNEDFLYSAMRVVELFVLALHRRELEGTVQVKAKVLGFPDNSVIVPVKRENMPNAGKGPVNITLLDGLDRDLQLAIRSAVETILGRLKTIALNMKKKGLEGTVSSQCSIGLFSLMNIHVELSFDRDEIARHDIEKFQAKYPLPD
eukprot:g70909.t1